MGHFLRHPVAFLLVLKIDLYHFAESVKLKMIYRVDQKKCPIASFSLNLFQRSDYTFSCVFRNQNFEPVPSKHFKHTHSKY